jgi:diguanylate cyclase (GGDEF)-like protein
VRPTIRGGLIDEVEFDRIDSAVKVVLRTSLPVLGEAFSFITVAIIRRDLQTMRPVWAEHSRRIKTNPAARKIIRDREIIRRDTDGGLMWEAVNHLSRKERMPKGMTKKEDKTRAVYFIADGKQREIRDIIIPTTQSRTLSVFLAPILCKHGLVGMLAVDSIKANAFRISVKKARQRIDFLCALSTQLAAIVELLNGTYYDRLAGEFGVNTRAHFDEQFDKLRTNNNLGFLAYFDLNRFKYVNDQHDHERGNTVLQNFAKFTKDYIDSSGLQGEAWLYRFGGDEFALLITRKPALDDVRSFFRALIQELPKKTLCCRKHVLSSSIGFVSLNHKFSAVESIRMADSAMYWSKEIFRAHDEPVLIMYRPHMASRIKTLDSKAKTLEDQMGKIQQSKTNILERLWKEANS